MKKILAVDDEQMVLAVIRKRLEFEGFEVITAAEGLEGFKKARTGKPDLIVLDLILPGLNGYQICSMLKGDENYKRIPILMLSARSQERDIKEGMRVGADAYMTKPFETEEFVAQVKALLDRADAQVAEEHASEQAVADWRATHGGTGPKQQPPEQGSGS